MPQHYLKCLEERAKKWDEEDRRAGRRTTSSAGSGSNAVTELERVHCILCERYFSTASQLKYVCHALVILFFIVSNSSSSAA